MRGQSCPEKCQGIKNRNPETGCQCHSPACRRGRIAGGGAKRTHADWTGSEQHRRAGDGGEGALRLSKKKKTGRCDASPRGMLLKFRTADSSLNKSQTDSFLFYLGKSSIPTLPNFPPAVSIWRKSLFGPYLGYSSGTWDLGWLEKTAGRTERPPLQPKLANPLEQRQSCGEAEIPQNRQKKGPNKHRVILEVSGGDPSGGHRPLPP